MEEPAAASAAVFESHHAGTALPELSQSQTALDGSLDGPTPTLRKRKSLRPRPSESLQQRDAISPSPLRPVTPQRLELRRPSSKMSLFSLFSKPKVEKQRGYAEPGLETSSAQRAVSLSDASPLKNDVVVRVQHVDAQDGRMRPTSSKSFAPKRSRLYTSKEPLPLIKNERHPRQSDAPLFQVWPQTTKSATLEVSTNSSDTPLQRPKNRFAEALLAPTNEILANAAGYRGSVESRQTTLSRSASISGINLPRKVIVLTTSGYLLQYAENGPSDRLPEKILTLGKDSAAFASDLIPGKHHVLQVSQAVNSDGVSVTGTQSILSRFTIRRLPTSRTASTFLLVMAGPDELYEWMSAVKRSIEEQGGKPARSDSAASRPQSRHSPPSTDLTETLSVSHRLQVKRDASGPSSLASPKLDAFPSPPLPSIHQDATEKQLPCPPETTSGDESEANTRKADEESIKTRPRAPSDCPSVSSSTAFSVEQQQLEKLRGSVRMSHTSTVATSVTVASRTNSMTSSPSEQSKDSADGAREPAFTKLPYRTQPFHPVMKRRSGIPLPLKESRDTLSAVALMQQRRLALMDGAVDSPIIGFNSPLPEPSPSPRCNHLSFAKSTPDLKAKIEVAARNDSKLHVSQADVRPESFIADLPDPTLWMNKPSPSHRMSSSIPFPPLLDTTTVKSHQRTSSGTRISPTSRPLRTGSNSFSLPRSVPLDSSPPRPQKRSSSDVQEERVLSPIPAVHTLTAKVDVASRTKLDSSCIPTRKSSISGSPPALTTKRAPPAKLSLFPCAHSTSHPTILQIDTLRRSPSAAALSSCVHLQAYGGSTNTKRLARPASLQVRANHAPFVTAIKAHNGPVDTASSTATVPIRSLKPSRSMTTVQTKIRSSPPRTPSSFAAGKFQDEAIDEDSLLHTRAISPIGRPSSGISKSPRSAMRSFDVSSLGPPAPPPSTPLPELPTGNGSRPQIVERGCSKDRLSMIRAGTPIGIAISEALSEDDSAHANTAEGVANAVVEEEKV